MLLGPYTDQLGSVNGASPEQSFVALASAALLKEACELA